MKRWAGIMATLWLGGCGGVQVSGYVRDSQTGEPLPGAEVRVDDEVTFSDPDGHYRATVSDDAPKHVFIDRPGYRAKSMFVVAEGKGRLYHDIELDPEGEYIEPAPDQGPQPEQR